MSKEIDVNVGDVFKKVTALNVNVGDAWKEVTGGYVNVGDSWKQFYAGWTDPTTYTNISTTTRGEMPVLQNSILCPANSDIWFKLNAGATNSLYAMIMAIDGDSVSDGSGGTVTIYDSTGAQKTTNSISDTALRLLTSGDTYYWLKFTAGSNSQYVAVMFTVGETLYYGLPVFPLGAGGNITMDIGTPSTSNHYYTAGLRAQSPQDVHNNSEALKFTVGVGQWQNTTYKFGRNYLYNDWGLTKNGSYCGYTYTSLYNYSLGSSYPNICWIYYYMFGEGGFCG